MITELINGTTQIFQRNSDWMTWNLFLAFIPLALSVLLFRQRREYRWLWWLLGLMSLLFFPSVSKILGKVMYFRADVERMQLAWFVAFVLLATILAIAPGKWAYRFRWWLGLIGLYAFLPNAPYLLTDIIHLIDDIRYISSVWIITLVLIPIYIVVILAGMEAYVLSLINFGYHLHRIGRKKLILWMELSTHLLCALGIYLGRFLRFNSWDLVTKPDYLITKTVEDTLGKQPLVIIAITFVVLAGLYWIMKVVTLSILNKNSEKGAFRAI
ncbi:MAG: DUF1361 domain-containing protein [Cyanobacteria bacterium P01_A01_bin.84]